MSTSKLQFVGTTLLVATTLVASAGLVYYARLRNQEIAARERAGEEESDLEAGQTFDHPLVDDDTFEEMVRNAKGTVLVDFYADWCGPCKKQGRILRKLDPAELGATIVKMDVDQSPKVAQEFDVSSIPTLIVFRNGALVNRQTGVATASEIKTLVKP